MGLKTLAHILPRLYYRSYKKQNKTLYRSVLARVPTVHRSALHVNTHELKISLGHSKTPHIAVTSRTGMAQSDQLYCFDTKTARPDLGLIKAEIYSGHVVMATYRTNEVTPFLVYLP